MYDPAGTCKKEPKRFPIEHGENMGEYFMRLIDKIRAGDPETESPAERAYYTQTALIMGYLALREGKTMRFDAEKEQIVS